MRSIKILLILSVLWAHPVLGADAPVYQAQDYLELEEVLVLGSRPVNNAQKMSAWLSRLVGEFRYSGHVERHISAETAVDRAEIQGSSQCFNIGAPGLVQCVMNVTWQDARGSSAQMAGGAPSMTPAVALYGLYRERSTRAGDYPDAQYIGHMQVDNGGMAEVGMGQLFDDTLKYTAPCVDLPGNCQRVVQIEAPPDGKVIRMSVDIQQDSKLAVRYVLQWNRMPLTLTDSDHSGTVVAGGASAIIPANTQTWLRKLVGNFRDEYTSEDCLAGQSPGPTTGPGAWAGKPCSQEKSGKTECLDIGSGSGVRCLHHMGWQESRVPASRFGAGLDLWGYDPVTRKIVVALASPLAMDRLGGVTFNFGQLSGNTVSFSALCSRGDPCTSSRYTIPTDGRFVQGEGTSAVGNIGLFRLVRIGSESADIPVDTRKTRNPSPRRP